VDIWGAETTKGPSPSWMIKGAIKSLGAVSGAISSVVIDEHEAAP
jgi:hypothetical protein